MSQRWEEMVCEMFAIQSLNVLPWTLQKLLEERKRPTDPKVRAELAQRTLESLPTPLDDTSLRHFVLDRATPDEAMMIHLAMHTAIGTISQMGTQTAADQAKAVATLISDSCTAALVERGLRGIAGSSEPKPNR